MAKPIISVENLSKAYRIGAKEEVHDTLIGAAKGILRAPFKNLKNLRSLDTSHASSSATASLSRSDKTNTDDEVLWALRDVSFEINEGDVVGIIGRNGAGKSTLLKILSRITEPTGGRAVIRGRVSSLLEVGTGFHPELTGRENVYMNGTILGMTKTEIDRKFDEIVEFSGVEKFLDTPTKRYSSGMQVRLAFAIAAHLEPEILIVDEVLAVGDSEFQKKCIGKMQHVAGSGRTVMFVSHNMSAVIDLCSSAVEIFDGIVRCVGPVQSVVEGYLRGSDVENSVFVSSPNLKRKGNGEAQVSHATLKLADGKTATSIPMGTPFFVDLRVNAKSQINDVVAVLGVYDLLGTKLFNLQSTQSFAQGVPLSIGENELRCTVPELNLLPGEYLINISLRRQSSIGLLDRIEAALTMHIVSLMESDTDRVTKSGEGFISVDSKWSVRNQNRRGVAGVK